MTEVQRTVLIVEDDRNTANLVATYLQREGFATLLEHDGAAGLERARTELPNLVIKQPREVGSVEIILNNSFGMLGINSVVIVRKFPGS